MTRILSGVIAAAAVIGVAFFFQTTGLYALCSVIVLGCIYEYSQLTLKKGAAPFHIQVAFMILATVVYAFTVVRVDLSGSIATLAAVIFLAMGVVHIRRAPDLSLAFKYENAALLGLFYVGLFPGLAISILGFENGIVLFFALLFIVFAGDTFAYFFGRLFGKHKLLEAVSPKKTVEGSLGGLLGSGLAGAVVAFIYLPAPTIPEFILIAIVSGAFAQIGDLFESQVKRLADVKDSGRIMPGHGGFLDRLDGVLFAAPLYYVLLHFLV